MFWTKKTNLLAEEELGDLKIQIKSLVKERRTLKEELEDLKLKKRLEHEEIVHMSRINEERMKQEVEAEKLEVKKKYQDDINAFKEEQRQQLVASLKEFHVKMEERFNSELSSFKEMHKVIIDRLPNINYEISRHIGEPKQIGGKNGD
jgi:regulator of replication initiation timing